MTIKIDISKLQTEQLDATSLNWISKFAQALERHDGTVLELQSADLLHQLVIQAKKNHTAELQEIYQALKSALRAQVKREPISFEKELADIPKEIIVRTSTPV